LHSVAVKNLNLSLYIRILEGGGGDKAPHSVDLITKMEVSVAMLAAEESTSNTHWM